MAIKSGFNILLEGGLLLKDLTDGVASNVTLAGEAVLADAGHGAPGQRVVHLAVGVVGTGLGLETGVLAVGGEAAELARTVLVALTAHGLDNRRGD